MKRLFLLIVCLSLTACASPTIEKEDPINLRLTTTTSVNDSGLLEYLRPHVLEDLNMNLEIVSLGSGAALEAGQRGDADVLLVHSPAAEETFVKDGYGIKRSTFMYNFFVIVGPEEYKDEFENLSAMNTFLLIYKNYPFISRGDNSGTHSKEKSIWKSTELDYETVSQDTSFYVSSGSGMGDTLIMASEKQAFTLTDLATFLSMQDKLDLEVIINSSKDLLNDYSVIVVNPDKVENVNSEAALRFEEWMLSEKALQLIAEYGKEEYKQALFFTY
jgi:tungstate transport system substrate-binding protein